MYLRRNLTRYINRKAAWYAANAARVVPKISGLAPAKFWQVKDYLPHPIATCYLWRIILLH